MKHYLNVQYQVHEQTFLLAGYMTRHFPFYFFLWILYLSLLLQIFESVILESREDVWLLYGGVKPLTRQTTQRSTKICALHGPLGTDQVTEHNQRRVRLELAQVQHTPKPRQQIAGQTEEYRRQEILTRQTTTFTDTACAKNATAALWLNRKSWTSAGTSRETDKGLY